MEKLITLAVTRLRNLELVQLVRDTVTDVSGTQVAILASDVPLANYLAMLTSGVDRYETAIRNPQKNPYTELLIEKDRVRDQAFARFGRKLSYFELSTLAAEQAAADTLSILWEQHRDTPRLNYQAQTSATDNFLADLTREPYVSALAVIDLSAEANAVKATNDEFRTVSADKRAKLSEKEFVSAKELRSSLSASLSALGAYVNSMAQAYAGNADWEKVVAVMNVVRDRYVQLLARRTSSGKETTPTDTPSV